MNWKKNKEMRPSFSGRLQRVGREQTVCVPVGMKYFRNAFFDISYTSLLLMFKSYFKANCTAVTQHRVRKFYILYFVENKNI
jgi:hypothetical protein